MKRVTYTNPLDGAQRVLVGRLTDERAQDVLYRWRDEQGSPFFLPGTRIEECDGAPDGSIVAGEAS